jgi:mitochondrial ATPase complex subunit ATP10
VSNVSAPAGSTSPGGPPNKKNIGKGSPQAPDEKIEEDFRPKPLQRPLGLSTPPKAGENVGVDTRTWRQRREDFFNYDKHIEKRKLLYVIP